MTDKQKRFCEEYVLDWNATRAAIAAGYSEKTAYSIGNENLSKPEIATYIENIQKDFSKLAGLSKLGVLEELKKVILETNTEKVSTRDKLKALEVVNKMLGFNEAEKQTITSKREIVNVNLTKTTVKPITNESELFDDD
ncbi:hypothetical protein DRO66_06555 [Candidatus Bathyarchaeota archaeon]|nr:MAG: hypothetical protein DRO66_06555 [Candidatus Bathyarchaeota archaeon]